MSKRWSRDFRMPKSICPADCWLHLWLVTGRVATAAAVGYAAVATLLRVVVSMKLLPFVLYCALLGTAVLVAGLP